MPLHTEAEQAKQRAKLAIRQDLSGTVASRGRLSGEADRRRRVNRENPDFNVGSGPGRKKKVIRTPIVGETDPTKPDSPVTPISTPANGKGLAQTTADRIDENRRRLEAELARGGK